MRISLSTTAPIPERREAVDELIANGESQCGAGAVLGVTEATVNRDIKAVTNVTAGDGNSAQALGDAGDDVTNVTASGHSQREAGEVLGVNEATINRDSRAVANATERANNTAEPAVLAKDSVANATPARTEDDRKASEATQRANVVNLSMYLRGRGDLMKRFIEGVDRMLRN